MVRGGGSGTSNDVAVFKVVARDPHGACSDRGCGCLASPL